MEQKRTLRIPMDFSDVDRTIDDLDGAKNLIFCIKVLFFIKIEWSRAV